jgi:glycerol 3-phosphatase-2
MTGSSRSWGPTLIQGFDGIVCDLDGVIYRGKQAVPHAVESLSSALSAGVRVVYATNNASRAPADVAVHLDALGLHGSGSRVVTSAQAGARYLAQRCPPGSRVLAVGGPGVSLALAEAGLLPVRAAAMARATAQATTRERTQATAEATTRGRTGAPAEARTRGGRPEAPVVAVLQGYGAEVAWTDLAEAAYAVRAGALWVATNIDSTLPTDRGLAPGNGALVGAVRQAVDVDPVVVGKPHTPLYELSVSVLGTSLERTLAIGDRLDTDISGATAAGMESLFVFGGVHGWADVVGAEKAARPRYVATDLRSLHSAYGQPLQDLRDPSRWVCGKATAWVSAPGDLVVSQDGALNERLRAALAALWQARDVRGAMDPRGGSGAALSDELEMATSQHG